MIENIHINENITEDSRIRNKIKSQTGLTTMDGGRMPHPPRLKLQGILDITNLVANKYQQIPQVIGRGRGKKCPKTEWRNAGRSLNLQISRRGHKQQRQPIRPHNRDRKEGQRSHRHYPCRNKQCWIQRNKDESHMANGGCHNHPNNNVLMWGVVHQQRKEQKTEKYFQWSTKNHPLSTPRDPNLNSPQRNRKFTNRIHHKK